MGIGEEWLEVTVRDWDGRKLYRERAYKNNQKKIQEIANTLRDKFSIELVGSIRVESIKERQEAEMQRVRERVQARKEQIGKKVRELFSLKQKNKNKF